MTIIITLTTAGADTGPFNLFSDVDGYTTAFVTGVSKSALLAGYSTSLAPLGTTTVRVRSTGSCTNYIDIVLVEPTTSTTSTTSSTTTCLTYYELAGCLEADYAYTLLVPNLGIGQQYVLPGPPNIFYTYTGSSMTSCTVPVQYNGSIQRTTNTGCPPA
jgi:hypothetical protein